VSADAVSSPSSRLTSASTSAGDAAGHRGARALITPWQV
jgi:hypothetical protein